MWSDMPPVCLAVSALTLLLADITLSSILLFLFFSLGFLHLITWDCQDIFLCFLFYTISVGVLSGCLFLFLSCLSLLRFLALLSCTLHFTFPNVSSLWLYTFSSLLRLSDTLLCAPWCLFIGNLNGFNSSQNFAQGPAYPLKPWNYSLQLYYLQN